MRTLPHIRALLVSLVLGSAANAWAGHILYASTGNSNGSGGGRIYTIDVTSSTVTLIGNTGLNQLGGLAFDNNGVLYGADEGSGGPSSLYTINTTNAAATLIGGLSGVFGVDALAFDSSNTLYGGAWTGVGTLITIDTSDASIDSMLTMSGSGNSFVAGLAFDAAGVLFGSRGNAFGHTEDLITINTTTGAHTAIGSASNVISDIWVAADGTLYGGSPTGDLFVIDSTTGAKTFLFNTGIRISGLTGLNTGVPDGGPTVLMLAMAIFGVALARRKRA